MKHLALLALLTLVISMLCSVDFTLDNGAMIIGTLEGIQEGNMYIVDTQNQLHIVPMDDIKSINAGTGDVAFSWKRKKPFMNIDPATYQLATNQLSPLSPESLTAFIAEQPKPAMSEEAKQLKRIANNLTYMSAITTVGIVGAIIWALTYEPNEKVVTAPQ